MSSLTKFVLLLPTVVLGRTWRLFLNCSYSVKVINEMWDVQSGSIMLRFLPKCSAAMFSASYISASSSRLCIGSYRNNSQHTKC